MLLIRSPLSIGTDRDLVDESGNEESGRSDDESEDEEPRINLSNVSQAVPKERVSGLLHNIATSRDILFWTLRGQLLRKKA